MWHVLSAEGKLEGAHGQHLRKVLASDFVADSYFHIDKPSSDNSHAFFAFAKETFGEDIPVQQCSNHIGGVFSSKFIQLIPNYSKSVPN